MNRTARAALALWFAALLLFLPGLGIEPLRDWDEGTSAQVAREMLEGAPWNWLYPTHWGAPYFNKPTLGTGLISASFALFGESAFAARLPGAFLTASAIPLFYLLALSAGAGRRRALMSAAVLLTLLPFMRHGRLAMLDGFVVFFGIAMLLALSLGRSGRPGCGLPAGLAVTGMALTKGLLAAPFLAIGVGWLAFQRAPLLRQGRFWLLFALGLVPAALWYLAQGARYGSLYLDNAVHNQGVARLYQAIEGNSGALWYYLLEILKYGWPWLLFLPAGLAAAWAARREPWAQLALIWAVGFFVLMSLIPTKLPWYIYPAWPALALLIGVGIDRAIDHGARGLWLLPVLGILSIAGVWYFSPWGIDPVPILLAMSVLLVVALPTCFWLWRRNGQRGAVLMVLVVYASLFLFSVSGRSVWELNEDYAVPPVAQAIRNAVSDESVVYTTNPRRRPSLDFYAGIPVLPRPREELLAPDTHPGSLWLTDAAELKEGTTGFDTLAEVGPFRLVRKSPATEP
ncbi:MAG: glycosyltransferase family 39 protein [Pseudomonadota bacterium]